VAKNFNHLDKKYFLKIHSSYFFCFFFEVFKIYLGFTLKFEYQGDIKAIPIDNMNDTLEKYILKKWPHISLEDLDVMKNNESVNLSKSIKDLRLKDNDIISILGYLQFIYQSKKQMIQILSSDDPLSSYVKKTKWNIDPDYIDCICREEKCNQNRSIQSLNLNREDVVELIDTKDVYVQLIPFNKKKTLNRIMGTLTMEDLKGRKKQTFVFFFLVISLFLLFPLFLF
jgi:hypothetical protein